MSVSAGAGELELGLDAVGAMSERAGVRLGDADRELLLSYAPEAGIDGGGEHRFAVIADAALRGFFHLAATGHAFVPIERFEDEFGDSLTHNYPGAGAGFTRLATSYWTLHMLEGRLGTRFAGTLLQQCLASIVGRVRTAFFAEVDGDSGTRALAQRDLIARSGAPIDADEFLLGNPLLVGNPLAEE